MGIKGRVTDKATHDAVEQARITITVEDEELAVLFSDSQGQYECSVEEKYRGKLFHCRVEKEGYETLHTDKPINQDEISLDMELTAQHVAVTLSITDNTNQPLAGVKVTILCQGKMIGEGNSDNSGMTTIILGYEYAEQPGRYRAERDGFTAAEGDLRLAGTTTTAVTLKPKIAPDGNQWIKPVGITVVIIVVAIVVYLLLPSKKPPRPPQPAFTVEQNTNRLGGDYSNFILSQPNFRLCQQACASDNRCKAYTYVKPGIQHPTNARCWLKNVVPNKSPNPCCVSGKKI